MSWTSICILGWHLLLPFSLPSPGLVLPVWVGTLGVTEPTAPGRVPGTWRFVLGADAALRQDVRLRERSRLGLSLTHISTNCTAPALPALQLVRRLPASLCSLSYMPTLGWALPTLLAGNKPRSSLRITLPGQPSLSHLGVQAMGTGLRSPIFFTITSRAYLFFFFFFL